MKSIILNTKDHFPYYQARKNMTTEQHVMSAYQALASATGCDAAALASLKAGQQMPDAAGELTYAVQDVTRARAAGCPTKGDAKLARAARGWRLPKARTAPADLTTAVADARAATQTACTELAAGETAEWAGQLGCKTSASSMHAALLPAYTGAVGVEAAGTAGNPTIGSGGSASKVWADAGAAAAYGEENAAKEARVPRKWRDGASYRKGDLVVHANAVAQCLSKAACGPPRGSKTGGAQPGTAAAAGVWGTAVPTEEELEHVYTTAGIALDATPAAKKAALDGFVAALVALPEGAEQYAAAWEASVDGAARTLASAYSAGSLALGEDGQVYECAPEAITGQRPARAARATTPALPDAKGVPRQREVLLPCCEAPPGTEAGKRAWKASAVDLGSI
jgi:hypothetical protein